MFGSIRPGISFSPPTSMRRNRQSVPFSRACAFRWAQYTPYTMPIYSSDFGLKMVEHNIDLWCFCRFRGRQIGKGDVQSPNNDPPRTECRGDPPRSICDSINRANRDVADSLSSDMPLALRSALSRRARLGGATVDALFTVIRWAPPKTG
jgi:hypothetical protein